ncbi:MAG: AAA family ATPase [Elusimicrobia bacterium]|nr:AAA family ATPase [Elusimicrobiota bacterium]
MTRILSMGARRKPETLAFFGKGGIGKSTLSSNISALCARSGRKVLHVGCDPKRDSTVLLVERPKAVPVLRQEAEELAVASAAEFLVRSRLGVDCVEAGGPEPGIGCAGRGIGKVIEILEAEHVIERGGYDTVIFDVLGDVVCGGFAAPMRRGFARKVVLVVSEETASLYAANNVARAVLNYASNGVALAGLLVNLRDQRSETGPIERFARRIGTSVLGVLWRDPAFLEGERLARCLVEVAPRSKALAELEKAAKRLLGLDAAKLGVPTPMGDDEFYEASRGLFRSPGKPRPANASPEGGRDLALQDTGRPGPPVTEPGDPRGGTTAPRPAALGEDPVPEDAGPTAQEAAPPHHRWMMWRWGVSGQWREFFADAELDLNSAKLAMRNVAYVVHKELECFYVEGRTDDGTASFFNHAWPDHGGSSLPLPFELRALGCRQVVSDIRDRDIILGGGRKIERSLEALAADPGGTELAVFFDSCPTVITGDDVVPLIDRFRRKSGIPVVFPDHRADQHTDVLRGVFQWVRKTPEFRRAKPRGRRVNLVGFPWDRALDELAAILRETGVEVNSCLLPEFDLESIRRYPAASLQVFKPHRSYEDFQKEVLAGLDIPVLAPPPPYGVEGTRRWLREIAAFFGLERRFDDVWSGRWAGLRGAWEESREEARGRVLGFVCDADRLGKLRDCRWSAGIPLLPALREMGFGLEWLLWCGCRGASGRKTCAGKEQRRGIRRFHGPEELEAGLRDGSVHAFYSDFAFDRRLSRTGKAQFSLAFFEPGLEGAQRSVERLLGAGRLPFYKDYARYLAEGHDGTAG